MKSSKINSLLFAFYLLMFSLAKPLWLYVGEYSSILLYALTATIILISTYNSISNSQSLINTKVLLLSLAVTFIYLLSLLLNYNEYLNGIFVSFIQFGFIPMFLYSKVNDYDYFLYSFFRLSLVLFLISFYDPFINYSISTNYMVYGFQMILPSLYGIRIGKIKFGFKYGNLLYFLGLALLLLFGNKMAIVSGGLFYVITELFFNKNSSSVYIKYFTIGSLTAVIILNANKILNTISGFLEKKGYYSYSVQSVINYLSGTTSSLVSGRDVLWEESFQLIVDSPIVGHGIGYFETVTGNYSHNVFLDFQLSFGILGLLLVIWIVARYLSFFKRNANLLLFGLLFLCLSFPKLLTSEYFVNEQSFWIIVIIPIVGLSRNCFDNKV